MTLIIDAPDLDAAAVPARVAAALGLEPAQVHAVVHDDTLSAEQRRAVLRAAVHDTADVTTTAVHTGRIRHEITLEDGAAHVAATIEVPLWAAPEVGGVTRFTALLRAHHAAVGVLDDDREDGTFELAAWHGDELAVIARDEVSGYEITPMLLSDAQATRLTLALAGGHVLEHADLDGAEPDTARQVLTFDLAAALRAVEAWCSRPGSAA